MTRYVDLADFLLIAEAVTGIDADVLAKSAGMNLADSALAAPAANFGGVEFYPGFGEKVAVLGWHLCQNHPLTDGNKRAAWVSMVMMARLNGGDLVPDSDDDAVAMMLDVASGHAHVGMLATWVAAHLHEPDERRPG